MDQVSEAIGGLRADVKALRSQWEEQDRRAFEGRRQVHDKINELVKAQIELTSRLTELVTRLVEVEAIFKEYESSKNQWLGVTKMLAAVWAAAAAFGGIVVELLVRFVWPRH